MSDGIGMIESILMVEHMPENPSYDSKPQEHAQLSQPMKVHAVVDDLEEIQ
jgi:hypothetical protein